MNQEVKKISDIDWIKKKIELIRKLYIQCMGEDGSGGEYALASYLEAMQRLLNGLANMDDYDLYKYEKSMLISFTRVFTGYFCQQINKAMEEDDDLKKKELILDIENALNQLLNVYNNLAESTSNADRLTLTGFLVDTNVYDLSPKLIRFYAELLNQAVELFQDDTEEGEFGFLLYPNICSSTETKQLFFSVEGPGRPVIIYISECMMEEVQDIPIYLLHELFHILTQKERCRRLRASGLVVILQNYLRMSILGVFNNHEIDIGKEKINEYVDILQRNWFGDVVGYLIQYIKDLDETDSKLYSRSICKIIGDEINSRLWRIATRIPDQVKDLLMPSELHDMTVEQLCEVNEIATIVGNDLQTVIYKLLAENKMQEVLKNCMDIYKEVYADIAMLLFFPINPQIYLGAFDKSILFVRSGNEDFEKDIRISLVADVMERNVWITQRKPWKDARLNIEKSINESNNSYSENRLYSDKSVIIYDEDTEKIFKDYFSKCASEILRTKRTLDRGRLKKLNNQISSIMKPGGKVEILREVFSGFDL